MEFPTELNDDAMNRYREQLVASSTTEALAEQKRALFGKTGILTQIQKSLGGLDVDARKVVGARLNFVRSALNAEADERQTELEERERTQRLEAERMDLTEVFGAPTVGHLHVGTQTRQELEDVFLGMGYIVADGPELEDDWHNFEALNFPPGHPARSSWDTFHIDLPDVGDGAKLLRTHTSPTQVRVMEAFRPPIYAVMPGQCYRRETADARHLTVFNQIEGLVVDRGITFGDLAGCIETFTRAYFGSNITSRLRPAFFPFTEPSAEYEVTCIFCSGDGCRTCSKTGWIELGGCGMIDPNVFLACGLDPEEYSGFAFGFGIERCAQLRHGLSDARALLDNDIRLLRQF